MCADTRLRFSYPAGARFYRDKTQITYRVRRDEHRPHVQQVRDVVHRASFRDDIARQLACIFEELVLLVDCVYMSGGE